jgi:succinyl-diaminopimelate desuccinylase
MDSLDLFKRLLSFKSNTPDDDGAFDFLEKYLSDFECIKLDINGVKNIFFYKDFSQNKDKNGVHLCFGGHIDVVPSGDGWDSNPFIPKIDGDKIIARGTQDMKSGVNAFVQAVKNTKDFSGVLSLLLTSDEEGPAIDGSVKMLEYLKKIDFLPHFALIAEPTCESEFGDIIKIGRRGSINGYIKVIGKQGHAAYPQKADNPINKIAPILSKLAGKSLDNGDKNFAKSEIVITDIRSGMQVSNVTPNDLKIMFNVRNSTNTNQDSIKKYIDEVFENINYSLEFEQSAYPFVTNRDSKIVKVLQKIVQNETKSSATLSTAGGTSDARYFGQYGVDTVEFGVKNDKIHALNESTSIKNVLVLEEIFIKLIKDMS